MNDLMKSIHYFDLERHSGDYENWPLKTELYYQGEATGKFVEGYVIEKQFETAEFFLLICSFNCPYEEANQFILLDKKRTILWVEHLGTLFSTYILENAESLDNHTLLCRYHSGDQWIVTIKKTSGKSRLLLKHYKKGDVQPEAN